MILPIVVQRLFYRYHAELLDTNRDMTGTGYFKSMAGNSFVTGSQWRSTRKCSPHRWSDFGRGCCWECRRKRRAGLTATHGGAFPKTLSQNGFRRICDETAARPAGPADDARDTV